MLKPRPTEEDQPFTASELSADIDWLLRAARRQTGVFILCIILGVLSGILYLRTRVPEYTATSVVMVDNRRMRGVQDAYEVLVQGGDSAGSFIDTQAEILKSDPVILTVIDKLQLLQDS